MTGPAPVNPPSGVSLPANLAAAAQQIQSELARRPSHVMVVSPSAGARLGVVHVEFLGDVGAEAVRIARREGLGTVDERHVDEAVARICQGQRGSKLANAYNTFGGVLAGIGGAAWYSIFFTAGLDHGAHAQAEYLVAGGSSIVAAVLLSIGTLLGFRRSR